MVATGVLTEPVLGIGASTCDEVEVPVTTRKSALLVEGWAGGRQIDGPFTICHVRRTRGPAKGPDALGLKNSKSRVSKPSGGSRKEVSRPKGARDSYPRSPVSQGRAAASPPSTPNSLREQFELRRRLKQQMEDQESTEAYMPEVFRREGCTCPGMDAGPHPAGEPIVFRGQDARADAGTLCNGKVYLGVSHQGPAEQNNLGLFAGRDIPAGGIITEYAGFVKHQNSFSGEATHALKVSDSDFIIDARPIADDIDREVCDANGRYWPRKVEWRHVGLGGMSNHAAKEQNSGIRFLRRGRGEVATLQPCRAFLVAQRPISAGEEVLWNYHSHGRAGHFKLISD